ncbi:type VI secretion system baseplate subunit TssE [Amphritea japonica]|uniref:Type VI secretion system protein n=1 Tax=Amphritea japonica ATCC BAA-1530 TaxID=1278309 RepID=A0A7R6P1P2_9GAMM|nr:type VI secretion system baseplate subunit TssE [Amphritea japonica]BBB25264.1 type VI secretion system protein [Amphritea japonica ATCC BAA-1530]
MLHYTLLQRVALGDEGAKQSLDVNEDKLRKSVQMHLQNMFNVRQGSVAALDDYGLPDFNDLDMSSGYMKAVTDMRKAIKLSLEKYEPRLERIRVRYLQNDENPLDLRFEINAHMAIPDCPVRVKFQTMMASDGLCKVVA